jgi:hypothetical protein
MPITINSPSQMKLTLFMWIFSFTHVEEWRACSKSLAQLEEAGNHVAPLKLTRRSSLVTNDALSKDREEEGRSARKSLGEN